MNRELTQERLKELLNYDEDTGVFICNITRSSRAVKGSVAGSINDNGYRLIFIDGVRYREHRLVWLYVYGYFPEYFIDHINGIRDDNRLTNLREVTNACNMQSCAISSANKSGYTGVHYSKSARKYMASIRIHSNTINLGFYDCKLDAGLARITAEDFDNRWTCDERCVSRTKIMTDLKEWINTKDI